MIEKALFICGSNASKLASFTSMLGVNSYKIAAGDWKISKETVDSTVSLECGRPASGATDPACNSSR